MFGLVHFTGTGRAWAFCSRFFSAGSLHFTESLDLALVRYTPCVEQGSKIEGFPFWTREPEAGRKDGNGEVSIAR
jgi:hypothetical protein